MIWLLVGFVTGFLAGFCFTITIVLNSLQSLTNTGENYGVEADENHSIPDFKKLGSGGSEFKEDCLYPA
jgi:hypothetical protein